jgi:hypothetical protein
MITEEDYAEGEQDKQNLTYHSSSKIHRIYEYDEQAKSRQMALFNDVVNNVSKVMGKLALGRCKINGEI